MYKLKIYMGLKVNRNKISLGHKIAFILLVFSFVNFCIIEPTNAWIGTGSGSSGGGSSGGGDSGSCNSNNETWMIDCAGISWIFYKAQRKTNSATDIYEASGGAEGTLKHDADSEWSALEIPLKNSEKIPAECSEHEGAGFWHLGINNFGAGGWWGHWVTLNTGNPAFNDWVKYRTSSLSGKTRQEIGVYKADHYASSINSGEILKAYQEAYLYENPGKAKPTSIPRNVWGFCYWPGMAQVRLTIKAIDTNGRSLSSLIPDKYKEGSPGTSVSVSVGNVSGYTKKYWGTSTSSSTWKSDTGLTYTATISKNVTIYAVYEPFNATSTLDITVSKNGGNYAKNIYVKPGDKITYRTIYNSLAQGAYNLVPQKFRVGSEGQIKNNTNKKKLGEIADLSGGWKNAFSIIGNGFDSNFTLNHKYDVGKTDRKTELEVKEYNVRSSEVGRTLTEIVKTNSDDEVKTTPKRVYVGLNSGQSLATIDTGALESIASALVPFNFINTTEISDTEDTVVYTGESKSIGVNITVNPKKNSLTTDGSEEQKYATTVKNAKYGIRLCTMEGETEKDCYNTEAKTEDINVSIEDSAKGVTVEKKVGVNIPDVVAGSQVCFYSTIYPGTSGADDNLDSNGDGETAYSERKCFKVAKRPSLQAWGGNIYTRGNILLTESKKHHLAGYNDYNINPGSGTTYTFGSWGELGIIATGVIQGLSSGAGTGYQINNNGSLFPEYNFGSGDNDAGNNANINGRGPGGSTGTFCTRSPLSFANSNCNSEMTTGSLGSATASNNASSDKESILRKFNYKKSGNIDEDSIEINDSNNSDRMIPVDGEENSNVYYYYHQGSFTITSGEVSRGITIASSDEDITISGDLVYSGTFNSLNELPKLVIYANNVNINCNVERIDALIIANDKVRTCSDSGDINNIENSTQLKVNGAIISNNLEANRTYGASTGANSIIPAEIINFDPTLYKFGDIKKANEETGETDEVEANLEMVFLREQAPRL